jgi:hypothetical protein
MLDPIEVQLPAFARRHLLRRDGVRLAVEGSDGPGPALVLLHGLAGYAASGRTPRGGSPRRVGWSPSTSGATAQASGGRSTCPRTRSSRTPSRSSQRSASPPPSSSGSRSAGAWPCSSPRLRGRPEPGSGAAATAPRRRGRRPLRTRRAGRPGQTAATTRPVGAQGPRPSPSGQGVASEIACAASYLGERRRPVEGLAQRGERIGVRRRRRGLGHDQARDEVGALGGGGLPEREAQRMVDELPGASLATLRHAGHDLHLDQPAAWGRVRAFSRAP